MPPSMNTLLPRFLRKAYCRDPLVSSLLIAGSVDAVIGGTGAHWLLFFLGMGGVAAAFALRWWQSPAPPPIHSESLPRRYLPAAERHDSQPLPILAPKSHRRS